MFLDLFNELPTGVFQVIFVWGKMFIAGKIIARWTNPCEKGLSVHKNMTLSVMNIQLMYISIPMSHSMTKLTLKCNTHLKSFLKESFKAINFSRRQANIF